MVKTIAVLGAGTMGHGIAHAAMAAGYDTRLYDVSRAQLDIAEAVITRNRPEGRRSRQGDGSRWRGDLLPPAAHDRASRTPSRGADVVIEAAPEKVDLKIALLSEVETYAPAEAVIASNTSALSITELAAVLKDPGRVGGMHFFNPVHKMKLVEIVRALETSEETISVMQEVAGQMGKETVSSRSRRASSPAASTR